MVLQRLLIIALLLVFISVSYAQPNQPPPLLVITDLRTLGDEASIAEAQVFSDFIRNEVEKTGVYRIISRNSMLSILKAKQFKYPCFELPCFVRMGRLLGADWILAGHLHRRAGFVELTLRTIDVKRGVIVKTVYRNPPTLSEKQLLGEWGLGLISEVLDIKDEAFNAAPEQDAAANKIPDAVLNKYPGMIYIPAGQTIIGSENGDRFEQPIHPEEIPAFYINKYEVTNQEYYEFVENQSHRPPLHWIDGQIPIGKEKHPVSWISFEDAEAYCKWKGGRLPTEFEWERAARGNEMRVFPWGNKFDPELANTWESNREDTAAVGSYPFGASPFGVHDMSGNVFEWTSSFFKPYPGSKAKLEGAQKTHRILRGGSWNFESYYARCAHRMARPGGERSRSFGFRMVRDAEQPKEQK
ncbi:SUMF1/EgtB/PvdO family nonheme iron enzyme [bacterium]|nr:SUMF1/EgtB/PvdO family nonheme iron enzyme [bacterium]